MRLTPAAGRLWTRLRGDAALTGFVLVGRSALALHLGHRVSEDLDFAFRGTEARPASQLPRRALDAVLSRLRSNPLSVEAQDSPADWFEFENAGMDLHDHRQNYLVDGVKVSFFMPPNTAAACVLRPGEQEGVRLSDVDELFRLKALVTAERSKTRDWFDLYYLMTGGGYTMGDFVKVFETFGSRTQAAIALDRLCSGRPGVEDTGFNALAAHAPSLAEMTAYFNRERDRLEQEVVELVRGLRISQGAEAVGLTAKTGTADDEVPSENERQNGIPLS